MFIIKDNNKEYEEVLVVLDQQIIWMWIGDKDVLLQFFKIGKDNIFLKIYHVIKNNINKI